MIWDLGHGLLGSRPDQETPATHSLCFSEGTGGREAAQATQEAEVGAFQVQGLLGLQSEFEVTLRNLLKPCLKIKDIAEDTAQK